MLKQAAQDYLMSRRALGYKLVDTGELLISFTEFAAERGDQTILAATAVEWASHGTSVQRRHRRLRTLELFVEHLRAEDARHERIPIEHFPPSNKPRRYPPRIFSTEEIDRVLSLTSRLHPVKSIRPLTYRTLFGLLFTTGMRIGEALNLRLTDIQGNSLTIHQTKFGKSRWLPLHRSTVDALDFYLTQRTAWACDNDQLFLSCSYPGHIDARLVMTQP